MVRSNPGTLIGSDHFQHQLPTPLVWSRPRDQVDLKVDLMKPFDWCSYKSMCHQNTHVISELNFIR